MANEEHRKNTSETIRNYVAAIAIVVGGGWTVYEFASLERVERTRLERQIAEEDLERERRANLREALKEPTLDINLSVETAAEKDGSFVLLGEVSMENTSDIRVDIPLGPERSTLQLLRLEQRPGDTPLAVDRQVWRPRDHAGPVAGVTVLPGRKISLPFAFWVDAPGVYLISFQSEVEEASGIQDADLRERYELDKVLWAETRLIRVFDEASSN